MKKALPNVIAIVVLLVGTALGWSWPWGVLFLFWTVPALYSGVVHLITPVGKKENPALFWLIATTWIALSLYLIALDIARLF